jgi:hypothetical protein
MTKPFLSKPSRCLLQTIVRVAFGGVVAVTILTGCSATSGGKQANTQGDGVASVADAGRPSATPKASEATSSRSGKTPQMRLDTTDTEQIHMWQPYLHCLKNHDVPVSRMGATMKSASGSAVSNPEPNLLWYLSADLSRYPGANKACDELRPLPAPELDPKQNPHFMDDFRAQMDCMKQHGLQVKPNADGSGYRLPEDTATTAKIAQDCQVQASEANDGPGYPCIDMRNTVQLAY